jgi:hypothetical protein
MKYYEVVEKIRFKHGNKEFESIHEIANYLDALEQVDTANKHLVKAIKRVIYNDLELNNSVRLELERALAQYDNAQSRAYQQIDDYAE